jgi:hypothetical protein
MTTAIDRTDFHRKVNCSSCSGICWHIYWFSIPISSIVDILTYIYFYWLFTPDRPKPTGFKIRACARYRGTPNRCADDDDDDNVLLKAFNDFWRHGLLDSQHFKGMEAVAARESCARQRNAEGSGGPRPRNVMKYSSFAFRPRFYVCVRFTRVRTHSGLYEHSTDYSSTWLCTTLHRSLSRPFPVQILNGALVVVVVLSSFVIIAYNAKRTNERGSFTG